MATKVELPKQWGLDGDGSISKTYGPVKLSLSAAGLRIIIDASSPIGAVDYTHPVDSVRMEDGDKIGDYLRNMLSDLAGLLPKSSSSPQAE